MLNETSIIEEDRYHVECLEIALSKFDPKMEEVIVLLMEGKGVAGKEGRSRIAGWKQFTVTYHPRQVVPQLVDSVAPLLDGRVCHLGEEVRRLLQVVCGCVVRKITAQTQTVKRNFLIFALSQAHDIIAGTSTIDVSTEGELRICRRGVHHIMVLIVW